MSSRNTIKSIAVQAGFTWVNPLFAHENHGLENSHWHATDSWGFVALAAMVALAIWLGRGSK
jgi:hypothetical protein